MGLLVAKPLPLGMDRRIGGLWADEASPNSKNRQQNDRDENAAKNPFACKHNIGPLRVLNPR